MGKLWEHHPKRPSKKASNNEIIKKLAEILGGGGGGRPNLAQGAGPKTHKIYEVLKEAQRLIKATLEG
jgi:alanyl-tRNA synthetase (EC 6.1.1.7)